VYVKLASDLVAAITLMENAPVKSAVIESPERCRARYRSLKSPASSCVSITCLLSRKSSRRSCAQHRFPKTKLAFHQTSSAIASTAQITFHGRLRHNLRHLTSPRICPFSCSRVTQRGTQKPANVLLSRNAKGNHSYSRAADHGTHFFNVPGLSAVQLPSVYVALAA